MLTNPEGYQKKRHGAGNNSKVYGRVVAILNNNDPLSYFLNVVLINPIFGMTAITLP
jgi:hypothetical protein